MELIDEVPFEEGTLASDRVLRQQMLVNEREIEPRRSGGTPLHRAEGVPPVVEAPPRREEDIRKDSDRLQFRGA